MGLQHAGIIYEPTVSEFSVGEGDDDDEVKLLLCSDGVWEFLQHTDVASVVCEPQQVSGPGHVRDTAMRLALKARKRWIEEEDGEVVDDITALVVDLGAASAACRL